MLGQVFDPNVPIDRDLKAHRFSCALPNTLPGWISMEQLSEDQAKKRALECLDSNQIRNPTEEPTQAEELSEFWFWNPPSFAEGHPEWWGEWKVFREIDPEAGDVGISKMRVDMGRYFLERSELDPEYWDALRLISAKTLERGHDISEEPYLREWLTDMLTERRKAPPRKPGNTARKHHKRNGCIYFAMRALSDQGPMSQDAAAKWIAKQISLSPEAVKSIYKKARKPLP